MEVKLLILTVIFVIYTDCLDLICSFDLTSLRSAPSFPIRLKRIEKLDAKIYRCIVRNLEVTIANITVDKVEGTHMKGYKNSDVQWLTISQSNINFLPHGIVNFFDNIQFLDISHVGLSQLNQNDLSQFPNLRFLWARDNDISEPKPSTFDSNPKLVSIDFSHTKLRNINSRLTREVRLEYFNIGSEDNICASRMDEYFKYDNVEDFRQIRDDEIFCEYYDLTFCKVEFGVEILGIEKTKIVGEIFMQGFEESRVKKVVVSNSNFTKIPVIFGEKFKNLEILKIYGNIWSLKAEDLEKFRKLKKLNLAKNQLSSLKSDVFVFNQLLEYIDLSQNRLSIFGVATFLILNNLSTLILNNNPDIDLSLNSRHEILNSHTLKEISSDLDVINCHFAFSTFKYSGKQYYCEVVYAKLYEFYGVDGQHIGNKTNLHVEGLAAQESTSIALDPKLSYHFPNLKTIRIRKSNLMYLNDNNFHGLFKLQVVDLSNNKITEVPSGIFDRNVDLIFVDFSCNQILKIYEIQVNFPNLRSFKVLDNSPYFNDEFTEIDDKTNERFREVSGSYGAVINCSEIIPLPDSYETIIFNTTCHDQYVQQITEIRPLTKVISKYNTKSISILLLKSQVMYFLPTHINDFFPNLKTFTAVGKIRKIVRQNFAKLSKLEELELSQNDIEFIDDDQIFSENPSLKKICLRENKIKKISQNVLVNLKSLELLALDKNICALSSVFKVSDLFKNYKKFVVSEICGAKLPENFGSLK